MIEKEDRVKGNAFVSVIEMAPWIIRHGRQVCDTSLDTAVKRLIGPVIDGTLYAIG